MSVDLVIGLGEIGKPLADLLSLTRNIARKDIEPVDVLTIDAMHICFPYGDAFVDDVVAYVERYKPQLAVIHSTVPPGTSRAIGSRVECAVAYSPVRGRHQDMHRDMIRYTKFVAGVDRLSHLAAMSYFEEARIFYVAEMLPCEGLELAKLLETTYSGLLVAWAQEMDRYIGAYPHQGLSLYGLSEFFREIEYLPRHVFHPGHIGGHCIMPNIELLNKIRYSPLADAIVASNEMCTDAQKADAKRYKPEPF